jgi:hypothetical protein
MPWFPWPPPLASARAEMPARLVHTSGTIESLKSVAGRLERAFRGAGYAEISYYAIPGGFAMATRLEQFAADGTSFAAPERWSADVAPPQVFGLRTYLQALFRASPGRFRIIVLAITPRAFRENHRVRVTREEATDWVKDGFNKLPKVYDQYAYTDEYSCTALVYEFEKAAPDNPAVLKDPGLPADTHLQKSNILKGLAP